MTRRTFHKSAALLTLGALSKAQPRTLWDHYILGAAYYPEWWTPAEWETDFAQMQSLGINAVRMGEFAWALFEPAPGKFEFDWMDHAIDIARHHQVDVILSTPTASVPPWLYQQHPDVLGGDETGPYTYGGRKGYCTNSPNYLEASARVTTALAAHYGSHPGVIGWQLDNEPGFPFRCYDPNCEHAFQRWLKQHYETLDALNRAWNGAFWSNKFTDWSQIRIPYHSAEGGWQPAITLEYRRFFSDSFQNHLRRQSDILHARIQNQFVFTNWPTVSWSVNTFTAAARFLDATAWDNYVSAPGLSDFQTQYVASFQNDFARSTGPRQRFLCAEQIAYLPSNALPEGLRLQAYLNLAHGAHGHMYFEWRRPLAGGEEARPSLIKRADGTINPAKPVFERIGKEFARLGPRLANATTHSDIAVLYDFSNEWAQGFWSVGDANRKYDGEASRFYRGLKILQRNIDIIPLGADFAPYKLIAAPNLMLIDDASVARLQAFVNAGGTLVLNYRAATRNMDNSMRRVLSPGPFTEMSGVSAQSVLDLIEQRNLDAKLKSELAIVFEGETTLHRPRTILESLVLTAGAEPLATFRGGRMEGLPAVTRRRAGKGWLIYVGTDSGELKFHEAIARVAGKCANLAPLLAAPYGVEVVSRQEVHTTYYFLLNLTEQPHPDIPLPHPMDELTRDQRAATKVSLGPLEVAVLASIS
ncbi:MAG TPA: beta-galactosidase [Bryobacteraceae bacterium]|jgi:beta-galactosidase